MAEEEKTTKKKTQKSPLIGSQAVPTTLDKTTKIDIDTDKTLVSNIVQAGLSGGLDITQLEDFTNISNARSQIYSLLDTMANDSSVSAILKTYAEEVCEMSDQGHIVWCESSDPKISKFVNYLLNVMNVDKNIYAWVYCLLKYGDTYLKLYRESDYQDPIFKHDNIDKATSARHPLNEDFAEPDKIDKKLDESVNINIHKAADAYSYYIEMVADPGTMFELTKYGRTYGYIETPNEDNKLDYLANYMGTNTNGTNNFTYKMKSNNVNIYQADDFVHACLEDNFTRYPEKVDIFITEDDYKSNNTSNMQSYSVKRGKSILYDAYKVWREKALLENSILLNRITKSSVVRNISVEVGDMPKSQVQNTLRRVKELFEQKAGIDTDNSMVEYTNPGPVENNIYTATHDGKGAISVNAVGGDVEVKNLADLDNWVNKFYAAFGIPKAYYGYTDDNAGFNGGNSLAIISSVFAKSVKRVQNAILQAITDAINLILINKGCKAYLNNFVLKMKAPLTQEEKDYRENLSSRISAISNTQSLFADIETRSRKLEILKTLLSTLNYGDELIATIDEEIEDAKAQEEADKKAAEEEAKAAEEGAKAGFEASEMPIPEASEEASIEETNGEEETAELPPVDITMESFGESTGQLLTEEALDSITSEDSLPMPEELSDKDFTRNE